MTAFRCELVFFATRLLMQSVRLFIGFVKLKTVFCSSVPFFTLGSSRVNAGKTFCTIESFQLNVASD